MRGVKVGIVDVGSNSMRLLVAKVARGNVKELERERVYLRLGDDAYRLGRISSAKLEQTGEVAERFARIARKAGCERLETIVTAPGRQANNGDELVSVIADATRASVVVLDAEEEGRLAWHGAVSRMSDPPSSVAVVDLGGGSCEIAVGPADEGPTWLQSREQVAQLLEDLAPPSPDATLAVGGTARAIGRLVGRRFGEDDLSKLAKALVRKGPQAIVAGTGITRERAETLLGGTLVLTEVSRLLGTKLEVGRGGLREGAALALALEIAAVA